MKNINPLYLIEGRFLNSVKKFWNADKKFAKQRYFGGRGKELFKSAKNKDMQAVRNLVGAELDAELMGNRITATDKAKYLRDLENYIQNNSNWNTARSELWGETKALPGRAWRKAKRMFTRDNPRNINPNYTSTGNNSILPYAVAGGGLGLLGFTTLANSPEITVGTPDQ